jgi:hypothetical protein
MPYPSPCEYFKLSCYFGLVALLIAGAVSCGSAELLDFSALRSLQEGQRQSAELAAQLDAARRSQEIRRQVVGEVIEQRLSLRAAAARFRDLNAGDADATYRLRYSFPGQSDEERYCRWVIRFADNRLKEQGYPDRATAVTASLEAELEEHLQRDGALRLPAVQR